MEPNFRKMCRMSSDELKAVKGLKFWNEHGSIEFIDPVDVTEVDFADVVSIVKNQVEVYNEERHKDCYPKRGEKLNMPAFITLNDVRPKKDQTGIDKELSLKKSLEQQDGCEHLSYDKDKFVWTFKVQHFTKYGNAADEEDSRDSSSNVNGKSEADAQSFVGEKEIDHEMDIDDSISIISEKPNIFDTYKP
jgi:nuclear pore complex protein Nup98-Nup96